MTFSNYVMLLSDTLIPNLIDLVYRKWHNRYILPIFESFESFYTNMHIINISEVDLQTQVLTKINCIKWQFSSHHYLHSLPAVLHTYLCHSGQTNELELFRQDLTRSLCTSLTNRKHLLIRNQHYCNAVH